MKIELRLRTEAHVRTYFERTQDPQIQTMIPQTARTVEQAIANFEKTLLPNATSFGRTVYCDDVYVGDIWCYCINHEEEPNAMLSYCIFDKALWGKGVATEALSQFLSEIVPRFGLKTVGAFGYCNNKASLRVLEKNGFFCMETFVEDGMESAYYQKTVEETP